MFSRGDRILLYDGLIELRVLSTTSNSVLCQVVNGGLLGEHKGINLPGVRLKIPAVTRKTMPILSSRCSRERISSR